MFGLIRSVDCLRLDPFLNVVRIKIPDSTVFVRVSGLGFDCFEVEADDVDKYKRSRLIEFQHAFNTLPLLFCTIKEKGVWRLPVFGYW
jgi:hypothetical protein